MISIPYISPPHLDFVDTVGKFKKLTKRGEKYGRWVCHPGCGKNLTSIVDSLPNDCEGHVFTCCGCGRVKKVSAGLAAFLVISRTQAENRLRG